MEEHGKEERGNTLFSKRVPGGFARTYFIDVQESQKTKERYLILTESRNIQGTWTKHRVFLFSKFIPEWKRFLEEALALFRTS